jgi:hypothetical protein
MDALKIPSTHSFQAWIQLFSIVTRLLMMLPLTSQRYGSYCNAKAASQYLFLNNSFHRLGSGSSECLWDRKKEWWCNGDRPGLFPLLHDQNPVWVITINPIANGISPLSHPLIQVTKPSICFRRPCEWKERKNIFTWFIYRKFLSILHSRLMDR